MGQGMVLHKDALLYDIENQGFRLLYLIFILDIVQVIATIF
jgi:hypothetical protein